ncbi:MAG TPA: phosphotransferase [Glycomyces sp.]|nr:phosphotransferase [Glycomyces sp.]
MTQTETVPADLASAAAEALTAYDLPGPATVRPLRLLNNSVFDVCAGDGRRFALRLHRPGARRPEHTLAELTFLHKVSGPLAAQRVDVPAPVPAADGRLVVTVASPDATEPLTCTLLTWVDGKVRRPGGGLGARGVHQLGRALAHLHLAAESFDPPPGFTLPRWDAEAMFTERSPYDPGPIGELLTGADLALFEEVAERTARIFAELGTGPETYGLIHNDFILGNCHTVRRRPHSWNVGVVDFDNCGWGHYLYDFAAVLGNLSDYAHFAELRNAFLAGYRIARPLRESLEQHFPVLMAARHASHCLWAAGLARHPSSEAFDAPWHIGYRMSEVRRCLTLGRDFETSVR